MNTITTLPITLQVHPKRSLEVSLDELSPTTSWETVKWLLKD